MVTQKRRKNSRHRGTRTCGWGKMHRGKGDKGGSGNAGSGKRGDAKKPSSSRIPGYFGKTGFKPRGRSSRDDVTINVGMLAKHLALWEKKGFAKKEGDVLVINLAQVGIDKLLGKGKLAHKVKVTVEKASQSAKDAVTAAGGEIVTQ